ncbi:hypothetical protein ACG33_14300 [Steroidobacter denitrificans]|uniref:Alpha-2-macroglobulin n=1 Tax=Steroidobacter denitrificans TaxID=465721 RepID=A0A127FCV9_STEDE|nr:alpha-2-macroglobulin [Steroidobacter denitrificans]AMN48247.1 hypothetical protein ACG33_14300 [Steroidobacter denitrificans]
MASIGELVRDAARRMFGVLTWQPPGWVQNLADKASGGSRLVHAHPRRFAAAGLGLLVLLMAGIGLWRWNELRPRPASVVFMVEAPAATCYACEPPGDPNPLMVRFESSVAPLELTGRPLPAGDAPLSMRPALAGRWYWDDDRTLRFQPAADWPIGTTFKVSFARRGFTAPHVRLHEQTFEFSTAAFAARIADAEFHQDPTLASSKKVVATIAFTHPVDPERFERHVRLRLYERVTDKIEKELAAPAYTVIYDKLKLQAHVHSDTLDILPKAARLQVAIEPGVSAARGGNATRDMLETSVAIPGLDSLKVTQISLDIVRDERNEPDQVLLITTSFPVAERDLPPKVQAWLLPEKHPDRKVQEEFERNALRAPGYTPGRPYEWNPAQVRTEILATAQKLELTPIPGERDHYELHSLRYSATPGRTLFVKVAAGLKSFGGYVLGDSVEQLMTVPEYPRELHILHQGSLLSMSGDKTLSVFARNLPAMRIEVGRLLPNQLQHLVTQTYGNFATPQFHGWAFDAADITERFVKIVRLPSAPPGQAQYAALDLGEYLDAGTGERRGIFLLRVQAWDADNNRAIGYPPSQWNASRQEGSADARLLVVTDLGLVVKRALDGTQDVFVQSIATGRPVAGANIDIVGRNGLTTLSRSTDADGHARFPDMKSFQHERAAVLYLARLGEDRSFLPMNGHDRILDQSRFDVGGVTGQSDPGALAAYIFSDRGIYRPGEEIRAAAIVRTQDWAPTIEGLPLRLEITDSRGTTVRREIFTPGPAGFGEIRHETRKSAPTGTYTLALSIVRDRHRADLIGSTTVQVRDFLPDRLRMQAGFSIESVTGWVTPEQLEARIQLDNLFGTPAGNRRVAAQLTLNPSIPAFHAFPDYRFHDPHYAREGFSETLTEVRTDAQGRAVIPLNLQRFARATYRVHLVAQGFEADGGRGVTSEAAQLVSSMPYLIGYKTDGEVDYLSRDSERNVELIAIDPDARRMAVDGLTLVQLETRFTSVLMRQPNGTYKYESRRKETVLQETSLAIPVAGLTLSLPSTTPGSFAYLVRDAQGQQLVRIDYQVAGEGNVTRTMEKNAELELTLDQRDYAPGEEIEMSIRAPYAGSGLITIEREKVHAWRWFQTSTTSTVQRIRLPEGLEGNAYVNVTFVRDAGSPDIYASPLSYGVQAFSIDTDARRNTVDVQMPAQVKPGEDLTFRYRTSRPARLVLFAVDEGILQAAGYRAPDPLGHFFQKRALSVSTTQILDLILPEFRLMGLSSAPGGDADGTPGKYLNPFRRKGEKPVVYWSGIVDADTTPRELTYRIPDYFNGSLRVLAVAVSQERIGVHDGRTLVRGDLVLSPNVPTTVTPGDEFDVSVAVANAAAGSGTQARIQVSLDTGASLEILGEARRELTIATGHEDSARFRLRARDPLGPAELRFTAYAGRYSGRRSVDLSIRPATPYMTRLKAGVLERGEQDVRIERNLYPQHRRLEAGISALPLQLAHGFVSYLANYPYACTEQIVSQAMPAVVLAARPEFGYVRAETGADVAGLIDELRARQNDAGAYKLWPGGTQVSEFTSLYAQHLLIEAAERQEPIPADLLERGNGYLQRLATRDGDDLTQERQSAYAMYLLARQGQRVSGEVAAARARLEERYRSRWERDLTAGWLAATLKLMHQDRDAQRLIGGLRFSAAGAAPAAADTAAGESMSDEIYNDPMTRDAWLLLLLSRHFPERLRDLPDAVLTNLTQRLTRGEYHSLSSGAGLLALDAYADATGMQAHALSLAEVLQDKRLRPLQLPDELFPKVAFSDQAGALRFGNDGPLKAYYLVEESGFDRQPPTQASRSGLEVLREYTDTNGRLLEPGAPAVAMGQSMEVRLKFRSLKADRTHSVALVDLLPGGFELVVPPQDADTPFLQAASAADDASGGSGIAYTGWQCRICRDDTDALLQYADLREDRVVFYVSAGTSVSQIVYRIKATNVGDYVVPPAYGEAMYDRSVMGRSTAGRISVSRP